MKKYKIMADIVIPMSLTLIGLLIVLIALYVTINETEKCNTMQESQRPRLTYDINGTRVEIYDNGSKWINGTVTYINNELYAKR